MQDLFQLGVILLRKKLYTQACKNLEKAKRNWGGDPEELAQVGDFRGFFPFVYSGGGSMSAAGAFLAA